jgi:hypothetical protein
MGVWCHLMLRHSFRMYQHRRFEYCQRIRGTSQNLHERELLPIQRTLLQTKLRNEYGNALSPFIANLFMADLETELSKLKIFSRIWIRYVDNVLCVAKRNTIDRLLIIMNRRHATIKFTHEIEIIKNLNGSLEFEIFRKPTSTSRYITSDSHHNFQHKSAAFNTMLNRACTYPISDDHRAEEVQNIKNIAKVNGYSEKFVDNMYRHHLKKKELRELTTLIPDVDMNQTLKELLFHSTLR